MKIGDFNKVIDKIKRIEGIVIKEKENNHRRIFVFYKNKMIMKTKISHGSKIKSGDIKNIANDLHFRVDEIIPYGKCTISNETYLATLKSRNYI